MDIRIGIRDVAREVTLESQQDRHEVEALVTEALEGRTTVLALQDSQGRRVLVPAAGIAYVDLGSEDRGRVGFGAV
ncbi:Protein of unknown function [Kytococcus aerolatus]|uniref:ATP-binding protein n=1 Tax=Kytococcus aerolatus TaxID=592308 RepID=A0A212T7J2_9MICO|nr:DUF3107 domain-containing protein [Kytococcus aerolatus]SNC61989.1 Protein of unknown function [Kytococcus aerolatus]